MRFGSSKCGVKLLEIVASAFQGVDFGISHVFYQGCSFRILLEELMPIIVAIFGSEILILPIWRL